MRHLVRGQPVAQRQQALHRRLKLRDPLLAPTARPGNPHARGHLRLVDIQRARTLNDRLHRSLLSPDHDATVARGAQLQTSLMVVLNGTVRGAGRAPAPN
jgi:hypothetical protein